jgi:hypothetical protein
MQRDIVSQNQSELDLAELRGHEIDRKRLILNNVAFPIVGTMAIPAGIISVPVKVQDLAAGEEHSTTVIAGHMGMTPSKRGTTVQPRSGWFMLQNSACQIRQIKFVTSQSIPKWSAQK